MTDRRERIAEAIRSTIVIDDDGEVDLDTTWTYDELPDAVLAALADDLLPELPEWVTNTTVRLAGTKPLGGWQQGFEVIYLNGNGPTIPAAIRNALKDTDR